MVYIQGYSVRGCGDVLRWVVLGLWFCCMGRMKRRGSEAKRTNGKEDDEKRMKEKRMKREAHAAARRRSGRQTKRMKRRG
uniref:Uncharacterized protein n=1 Tax=Knipowitschia caucasica TaxID=637954 RepID=A0AAV2JCR9_KNICA